MAEERVTTYDAPGSGPQTVHTTVVREGSATSGLLVGLVIVFALLAGLYVFTQMSGAETAKDNAVAQAANDVGNAARQIGTAAQDAGSAAKDAVNK